MDYPACLQYLDRLGNEVLTMKLGLDNIRRLLERLGDPHREYPTVLVAGTNGKGSTARFLASILHHGGYRTGLYTSPHLVDLRERISVDGRLISEGEFAADFTAVAEAIGDLGDEHHPTYFETLTATGFLHFSRRDVEVAVLEVGLGGRLDSTNVVLPKLSIVTPLGLDHTHLLGGTLREVAFEKGGIIHPRRPVVLAPQPGEAFEVLHDIAAERAAPLHRLRLEDVTEASSEDGRYGFRLDGRPYRLPLYGRHQVENAALALRAAGLLAEQGFQLDPDRFPAAVAAMRPYSVLRKLGDSPALFADGGHNREAAGRLREFVLEHTAEPRALVLGMMRDKPIEGVASVLTPGFQRVYLTRIDYPRAASLERLQEAVPDGLPVPDPMEALQQARKGSATVVVTGSLYLIGEVVGRLEGAGERYWDDPHVARPARP